MFRIIKELDIKFMEIRKIPLILSSLLLAVSILSIVIKGFNFGIDFSSGYIVQLKFDNKVTVIDVQDKLSKNNLSDSTVQLYGSSKEILIKLKDEEIFKKTNINNYLKKIFNDTSFTITKLEYVGAQVGSELREKGEWAMLIALFSILIYIALRFELIYGLGAISALIHDVIITLGFFSFFNLTFDLSVLAAVLAVIGYSLNDSIVVFDRIRENNIILRKLSIFAVLNKSINQTLSRTLVTSFTTMLVIISLLIFGGNAVENFSIAMLIGILIGTYSSIFIASTSLSYFGIKRPEEN
ncbi:MAG: protein translocase subunit SecF [Gammaproteobacteria bacterium]|jgi:preprotein translocase subunit SecF|nr:protein translocase subunit SecF [Gammaproteobacteria bacterium]